MYLHVSLARHVAQRPNRVFNLDMHKLAHRSGNDWIPHSHAPAFTTENTDTGIARVVASVPGGDTAVILKLIDCLTPPFFVLYVLHTSRGEGDLGRYQSPSLDLIELRTFLSRFKRFLTGDGRFDLWIHSPNTNGTIVWDRHDLAYCYGPLERYSQSLSQLGFPDGAPYIPVPHMHYYRQELDDEAAEMLSAFAWRRTPLHAEDEQHLD